MNGDSREVIPAKDDLSDEQRELMCQLNKLVVKLFDLPGHLRPCRQLNDDDWERLLMIRENPERSVSYYMHSMEDGFCGHIWLNLFFRWLVRSRSCR